MNPAGALFRLNIYNIRYIENLKAGSGIDHDFINRHFPRACRLGSLLLQPAHRLFYPVQIKWFKQIISCSQLKCFYCIFPVSRGKNNLRLGNLAFYHRCQRCSVCSPKIEIHKADVKYFRIQKLHQPVAAVGLRDFRRRTALPDQIYQFTSCRAFVIYYRNPHLSSLSGLE